MKFFELHLLTIIFFYSLALNDLKGEAVKRLGEFLNGSIVIEELE